MIRRTAIVLAIAGATMSTSANAQFADRLRAVAGGESASTQSASAGAPDEAAQESLVRAFIASQSQAMDAQISFARAFDLAGSVQALEAERSALSSGAVNLDAMQKAKTLSESVQAEIDARVAAQPELDAESKQHYAAGVASLFKSLAEGRKLAGEASNFTSGLQSLNAMQMASAARKLRAGAWVAKESPGYVRRLYDSSSKAVTFGRQSRVDIPANADSLLSSFD
ncbi:hypothetical protein AO715_15220 [Xanthomonas sp. Mitacek01]|nr:hypothetical protein AO715_15220 [Xanthomonas sp. Mitacek01]